MSDAPVNGSPGQVSGPAGSWPYQPSERQLALQERQQDVATARLEARRQRNERLAEQTRLRHETAKLKAQAAADALAAKLAAQAPAPVSPAKGVLSDVEDAIRPLIEMELKEISNSKLERSAKLLRLMALKACLGTRVSGFLKGMELYSRLKGLIPSPEEESGAKKKAALDDLEKMAAGEFDGEDSPV